MRKIFCRSPCRWECGSLLRLPGTPPLEWPKGRNDVWPLNPSHHSYPSKHLKMSSFPQKPQFDQTSSENMPPSPSCTQFCTFIVASCVVCSSHLLHKIFFLALIWSMTLRHDHDLPLYTISDINAILTMVTVSLGSMAAIVIRLELIETSGWK